jgi:hypothetical protein
MLKSAEEQKRASPVSIGFVSIEFVGHPDTASIINRRIAGNVTARTSIVVTFQWPKAKLRRFAKVNG